MKRYTTCTWIIILIIQIMFVKVSIAQSIIKSNELPGGAENLPAKIKLGKDGKNLILIYNETVIFEARFNVKANVIL